MAENSKIQWTDHTFNPWSGCTKVSPGCTNCYAEDLRKRWGKDEWGPGKPRTRTSTSYWYKPVLWDRAAKKAGVRHRVFCASLADWLDPEVDPSWRRDLLGLIDMTPHLDWLLLTKRPEQWQAAMVAVALLAGSGGRVAEQWLQGQTPANVWLGTTVEDQKRADERIPALLAIPAKVRFLSMEPLLESVSLRWLPAWPDNEPTISMNPSGTTKELDGLARLDWVIVGGESGPKARPFDVAWAHSIVAQCTAAGVPVFVKQMGANVRDRNDVGFDALSESTLNEATGQWEHNPRAWPEPMEVCHDPDGVRTNYQGASVRVRLRDGHGGDPWEWPEGLRVRQFPTVGGGK